MTANLFARTSPALFFNIALLLLLSAGCSSPMKLGEETGLPIFLIPAGFNGSLRVVYGEKCGVKPEMENGRPVYRFPENGLLILQVREGYYNKVGAAYYFVDALGSRQEITQVIDHSPSWTTDSKGNKKYFDRGNTTLEKYRHDQPVILIKSVGVQYVKPINIVNGEVTNLEEAAFVYMRYGVYTNGTVDTSMLAGPEEDKSMQKQVLACKESVAVDTKRIN